GIVRAPAETGLRGVLGRDVRRLPDDVGVTEGIDGDPICLGGVGINAQVSGIDQRSGARVVGVDFGHEGAVIVRVDPGTFEGVDGGEIGGIGKAGEVGVAGAIDRNAGTVNDPGAAAE